jgi:hypothetical protein
MKIDLMEIKRQIKKDKVWNSRARNIEIFHSHLILHRDKWSIRKTAKILNMSTTSVFEDIQLARFMIRNPSLERFKKRKEALNHLKDIRS